MIYDLRKNGKAGFEVEEVQACPVLKHTHEKQGNAIYTDFITLQVEAGNEQEAFEMFLGDLMHTNTDLSEFSVMPENRW